MLGGEELGATAKERFHNRIAIWRDNELPVWMHHAWWVLHNCVAHPLIGIAPVEPAFKFHDYTSRKLMAAPDFELDPRLFALHDVGLGDSNDDLLLDTLLDEILANLDAAPSVEPAPAPGLEPEAESVKPTVVVPWPSEEERSKVLQQVLEYVKAHQPVAPEQVIEQLGWPSYGYTAIRKAIDDGELAVDCAYRLVLAS